MKWCPGFLKKKRTSKVGTEKEAPETQGPWGTPATECARPAEEVCFPKKGK